MLPHRVVAYENAERKHVVYLRWRIAGEWVRKSTKLTIRTATGKLDAAAVKRAQEMAHEQYARLVTGGAMPAAPVAALTIAEGWTLATDPERGKWTEDTMHRREMHRAITRAKGTWGAHATWNAIDKGEIRRLWRTELKRVRSTGRPGLRSAEIVVSRVMALASWLRDEGKILPTACLPWKAMKSEIAEDYRKVDARKAAYEPRRLRYTLEEYRALLDAAPSVDERWGLLLTLGAEYRLGQVVRTMRSHVAIGGDDITMRIAGSGNKRGTLVVLTSEQAEVLQAALTSGYLAGLEAAYQAKQVEDYPVFPGVKLPRHDGALYTRADHAERTYLDTTALRTWLLETERKARVDDKPIAHVDGRGWYGLRRAAVDAAKREGISREGLQQSGGWANTQVPDAIYAEQEQMYAAKEAARVRGKIRGETTEGANDGTV